MATSPPLLVSVPDDELKDALTDVPESVTIIKWTMSDASPVDAIDIVVPPYVGGATILAQLASVKTRLVQSQMVGYDGVEDVLPRGNVYANASTVHETSTAELALALILASQRGIPDYVRAASAGRWVPAWHASLADRNVLIVGYGGVGRAIEARLIPFEVTVTRVALRARSDERGEIHGVESLFSLLPFANIVVVVVPLTEETTHLIDDSFLRRMPDNSLLVNVARGKVADTAALLAHATSGRLRLALDVTDPEPLPDGHPLFFLSNVLISPHVGGRTSAMLPRMANLLRQQIARMLTSAEPLNVVLRN
ncbi:MAG: 2-hydroxyacid dehydrogenase [Acidimicrobiales bacterium]